MDQNRALANLRALQSKDADIVELLTVSSHVVVYSFHETEKEWKRKGIEGSGFVVRRSSAPFHKFVVLNRLGTEDLFEDITSARFHVKEAEPYLMYRNRDGQIIGIWFYAEEERRVFRDVLLRVGKLYRSKGKRGAVSATTPTVLSVEELEKQQLQTASVDSSVHPTTAPVSIKQAMTVEELEKQHLSPLTEESGDVSSSSPKADSLLALLQQPPATTSKIADKSKSMGSENVTSSHPVSAPTTPAVASKKKPLDQLLSFVETTEKQNVGISREQFVLRLNQLLKEDDEFVDLCFQLYNKFVS